MAVPTSTGDPIIGAKFNVIVFVTTDPKGVALAGVSAARDGRGKASTKRRPDDGRGAEAMDGRWAAGRSRGAG